MCEKYSVHVLHLCKDYENCIEDILYLFDIGQQIFDMVSEIFCGWF